MPVIVQLQFEDGTTEDHYIPAEIWKMNDEVVTKVFITYKEVAQVILDPYLETADVDTGNNYYPPRTQLNRFEMFKRRGTSRWGGGENPMQRARRAKEKEEGTN